METEVCGSCKQLQSVPISRHRAACGALCLFAVNVRPDGSTDWKSFNKYESCHYGNPVEPTPASCPNGCFRKDMPKATEENTIEDVEAKGRWFSPNPNSHFLFIQRVRRSSGTVEWRASATIYLRDGEYQVFIDCEDDCESISYKQMDAKTLQEAKDLAFRHGLEQTIREDNTDEEEE